MIFKVPCIVKLAQMTSYSEARCDYCMFGMPWKKPTKFIGFNVNLSRLEHYRCRGLRGICARTGKEHQRLSSTQDGKNLTMLAQPYPRGLCREVACCFIDSLAEHRRIMLTHLLKK